LCDYCSQPDAKRNDALKDNGPSNETAALESRDGTTDATKDDRNRQKVMHLTSAASGVLIGYPKVKVCKRIHVIFTTCSIL